MFLPVSFSSNGVWYDVHNGSFVLKDVYKSCVYRQ